MKKQFPYLFIFILFLLGGLFLPRKIYAAGELKLYIVDGKNQVLPNKVLTDQTYTIKVDSSVNNGCKDSYYVFFTRIYEKGGKYDNLVEMKGNNDNAKLFPGSTSIPQRLDISASCGSGGVNKTGSLTIQIEQDPQKQPLDTPDLTISPTNPKYGEDVTMKVSKCPSNSTVVFSWMNVDGSQKKDSGSVSPNDPFTMQFEAPNGATSEKNQKLVSAKCGGKQSNTVSLTFQYPTQPTPTPKTDTPGNGSSGNNSGGSGSSNKVDMYEFKSPSYLPQYSNRYKILNNILSLVLSIISVISTGFLIWGGIQFITSEGDKQKVQAARGRITYAILGLILAFLSFLIVQLIGYVFDLQSTGRTILDITL